MQLFQQATKSTGSAACAAELLDVVPAIMRAIRGHMRKSGAAELTVPQFRTLNFLSCRRGSSLSNLAEHIGLSLPSASKLVQLLLTRRYLHRTVDAADRRRTVLAPTAKGSRVVKAARAAAQHFLAERISELSHEQREGLMGSMHTLRAIFIPELSEKTHHELRLSARRGKPGRRNARTAGGSNGSR